ncbi:vitamin K epoxide reductase family protein [Sulfurisphaera tokodaii]|uniref:vitamin K epoxide reductase family protein n=1 Tax=Sulfurisphaera tokodaii TaxID=111955 RepID=UPI0022B76642|nr:vitamin K epoxide reductase family protein [Sulfurisphaera tokodaii]
MVGIADSLYLYLHLLLEKIPTYCNVSAIIDCHKVELSVYSHFLGIPDSLLGLIYFSIMTILWLIGIEEILRYLWIVGAIFSMYLIYTEILIGSLCIYCTLAHLCCLIQGIILFKNN